MEEKFWKQINEGARVGREVYVNKFGCELDGGVGVSGSGHFCGECSICSEEMYMKCCRARVDDEMKICEEEYR